MDKIKVYGADWCGMTQHSRALLDNLQVDYDYINIENDPAGAAWVRAQNPEGKEQKPTIKLGSQILVEPSDAELIRALKTNGYVS